MNQHYDVEVFFDGECPLCRREIDVLAGLDHKQRIRFTDITRPEFDAQRFGLNQADFMDHIRGRLPDGTLIEGVEVFRRLYSAIGLGPLVRLTRVPGISHLLDLGYRWFAKHRLRLTGRCVDSACQVPTPGSSSRSS